MKTSSFFIVAVIVGILIESIIARYDVLNLNQQKKNITGKITNKTIHDCINFTCLRFGVPKY